MAQRHSGRGRDGREPRHRQAALRRSARARATTSSARRATSSASPAKLPGTVEETAALVERTGRRAMPVALDVQDEAAVAALAARVLGDVGARAISSINNAAVAPPKAALDDSIKRWRLAVDVNLNGPFYAMYHLCPRMAAAGGGRVINVSSGAAVTPSFGRASYTATKLALEGLTRVARARPRRARRRELHPHRHADLDRRASTRRCRPTSTARGSRTPSIMTDAVLWLVAPGRSTTPGRSSRSASCATQGSCARRRGRRTTAGRARRGTRKSRSRRGTRGPGTSYRRASRSTSPPDGIARRSWRSCAPTIRSRCRSSRGSGSSRASSASRTTSGRTTRRPRC